MSAVTADFLEKVSSAAPALLYPLQPGPYHELDQDTSIRIDFIDEIVTGINFKATKEHRNNRFSISGGTNPLFYKASFFNQSFGNHNIEIAMGNNQVQKVELDYNFLGSGHRLFGKFGRGITANLFMSAPTTFKRLTTISTISYNGSKSNLEIKASNVDSASGEHAIAGLSYCYGIRSWLAMGFELYYKFGQASGGGSAGGRIRGELFGLQYDVTSSYNIMGDLSLSSSIGIIPKFLSFSTRYQLNTSSMSSSIQVGTRIIGKPVINGYKIPLCLKLRTDNNFENAIALDLDTPVVSISIGCFGYKNNLFKNYGVNFTI